MNRKLIAICTLISLTMLLSAYVLPSVVSSSPSTSVRFQTTPLPTIVVPVATQIVVVPVTGTDTDSSTLLFYGILILAGIAFLIMLFALMRRPHDHDHL